MANPNSVFEHALPWASGDGEDRRFRRFLAHGVLVFCALGIAVPLIPVPDRPRQELERLPAQLARVELAPKPLPAPVVIPPPEIGKPSPVKAVPVTAPAPPPEVAPAPRPPPVARAPRAAPRPEQVQAARERAAASGLLQFKDMLAEMRDEVRMEDVRSVPAPTRGDARAASVDRAAVSGRAGRSSGGVDLASLSRDTGAVALASRQTTRVSGGEQAAAAAPAVAGSAQRRSQRSDESIRRIMDRNKGAIYAIYNRALRADPMLQGKLIFQLVIEPDGRVSAIRVVSSELGDSGLESKLLSRIRMIAFGADRVGRTTLNYAFDFLPS